MKNPKIPALGAINRFFARKIPGILILAICIGLTGCLIHLTWGQSWPETSGHAFGSDDAFISYRYAENLVKGEGLVFNQGERVEGFSNLGYLFFIALGFLIVPRDQIYIFSFVINCIAFSVAIFYFWKLSRLKLNPQLAGLATILFSLFPPFYQAVASGLETQFVVAGQMALLYYVCRSKEFSRATLRGLFIASAFLVVIRADGFVSPFIAVLYLVLARRFRYALAVLLGLLIPFTSIEIFRLVYYGYPLPNTYYAKIDGTMNYRILSAFRLFLVALPKTGIMTYLILTVTPLFFWLANLLFKRKITDLSFPSFFGAMVICYWIWIGGDIFWERFLLICYPIAILTIFPLLQTEFRTETDWLKRSPLNIVVIFVLVFNAVPLFFDGRFAYTTKQYDMFRELGRFLGNHYPGEIIAVDAAGKIPFYSQLRAIDMLGLNDATIAHRGFQSLVVGHNKFDPDYVLSRDPDLIVSWISVPSFDLDWGMAREKYSAKGYCLKYLVYSGLDKKENWIVTAENESQVVNLIHAGWDYAVLVKSDACSFSVNHGTPVNIQKGMAMKIHHLNCGTMFPRFPRGTQSISYCLLVETNDGLLLVDTGYGVQDYTQPTLFTRMFILSLGMPHSLEETAIYQVNKLGYAREDVRHIVLTHLHSDHAGGLRDFPNAKVHVHALEYQAVQSPQGVKERFYDTAQWSHGPRWVVHEAQEQEDWFGFGNMRVQAGLIPDIRLIPLHGHSRGHCGVAIQTSSGWLLHCGDATYPFYHENKPAEPFKPLPFYVMSPPKWLKKNLIGENTPRLMDLHQKHGDEIQLICSNDIITFSRQSTDL